MKKSLLVLLIALVLPTFSIQDKDKRQKHGKTGSGCPLNPRTYNGWRTSTGSSLDNCTSNFSQPPDELELSSQHAKEYLKGILSTRLLPAAYGLIMAVGIPSNIFVLACLSGRSRTCSGAVLHLSLATSDLLLLTVLAFRVHYHLHGNDWVFGEAACRLVTACFYGNVYCSVQALMCMSVMRYLAVARPFLYKGLPKRFCAALATVIVWLACGAAMVPELLVHQTYQLRGLDITTCHDVLPYSEEPYTFLMPYRLGMIVAGLLVPAVVIAFAYGSIVRHLGRSSCDWSLYVRASTLVFVIFVLCFTPSAVIHVLHYIKLYTAQQDHFYDYYGMAVCLCCFHSCLDPFLSYILSRTTTSKLHVVTIRKKPRGMSVFI
ncbi:proteinase-activated receptor 3 [Alosa pseudoharengus]|uniref:proteinase-activated receptor 3 n=1 Tax=Alosa pseudoharengus TaxID=34774 RepID=UPI003F8B7357